MGNLLTWENPDNATDYDQIEIYRSATEGGSYALTATIDIAYSEYYHQTGISTDWYKLRWKDSVGSVYSEYSTVIQASTTEPTCSADDLRRFLQISSQDPPTDEILAEYMKEAESLVNLRAPSLADEDNQDKINVKSLLLKYCAGALVMQNMDEGSVRNPTARMEKAKTYWEMFERLLSDLSSTDSPDAVIVKVRDDYAYSAHGQPEWEGT
jgi:hypothetical protein